MMEPIPLGGFHGGGFGGGGFRGGGFGGGISVQRLSEAEVSAQPLLAVELSQPMVFAALVFTRGSTTTGGDLRSVHLHSE